MSDYHEPPDELPEKDRDIHRALTSLKEEIEAVDWYHQRVIRTSNEELRSLLAHNRDEEIEHASMTLEWLRRNIDTWDQNLSKYLFSEGPVTELEESTPPESTESSLRIGSLKGESGDSGKVVP